MKPSLIRTIQRHTENIKDVPKGRFKLKPEDYPVGKDIVEAVEESARICESLAQNGYFYNKSARALLEAAHQIRSAFMFRHLQKYRM